MDKEFQEWLENDWFTSGETSWEEYYINRNSGALIMNIGGYQMKDLGYGVEVREYEAGWSFFIQGDDAQQFRDEWDAYQLGVDNNFRHFLSTHEYDTLFK
jgi:hypothetical protein